MTDRTERVYVQTNATDENEVVVWNRSPDGTLLPAGRFRTDGFGTGVELNSQGSLALSDDGNYLFVANAGSNDIASFAVVPQGLRLVGTVASGGAGPVSLTVRQSLLYAVNQFGKGSLSGFTIERDGRLAPLAGSQRALSADGATPAQVSFTPNGRALIVTELVTERITTFRMGADGRPSSMSSIASSGQSPFGFAFDSSGRLIVSEGFRNTPLVSAVSSYRLSPAGRPTVISASVPTHQTAACWIAITRDGAFAYASNTLSGSISGYRISAQGELSLLTASGRTAVTGEGSRPLDMAISADGRHLYVLNCGSLTVGVFELRADGRLAPLPYAGGIPLGASGLVIR